MSKETQTMTVYVDAYGVQSMDQDMEGFIISAYPGMKLAEVFQGNKRYRVQFEIPKHLINIVDGEVKVASVQEIER